MHSQTQNALANTDHNVFVLRRAVLEFDCSVERPVGVVHVFLTPGGLLEFVRGSLAWRWAGEGVGCVTKCPPLSVC